MLPGLPKAYRSGWQETPPYRDSRPSDTVPFSWPDRFTKEAIDVESPFGGELVDYGLGYEYLEKLVKKVDLILKGREIE